MIKTVIIEGVERRMASSAILVRQYRAHFGKDLMMEMTKATRARLKAENRSFEDIRKEDMEVEDLDFTVYENLGWLMLRNAGEDVGNSPEEWLQTLDSPLTIYRLIKDINELWNAGNKTTSVPKKK